MTATTDRPTDVRLIEELLADDTLTLAEAERFVGQGEVRAPEPPAVAVLPCPMRPGGVRVAAAPTLSPL